MKEHQVSCKGPLRAGARGSWLALAGLALGGLATTTAHADGVNASDKAVADELFKNGKELIAKGEVPAACDKFEASYARAAQLGTQLALASCYEKAGRTASALATFRLAAAAAARSHDKRQRLAEDRAAALEPRLSKIAVIVIANRPDGLEIRRDGVAISAAEIGTPVPVDPGEHTVEASAPGRVQWSIKVAVPATPGVVDVPVPALEPDHAPVVALRVAEPVAPPPVDTSDARHRRHLIALGVGGGGVAVLGTSLIFGALASSKWSDSHAHCHGSQCDATGVDLAHSAHTMGTVSTATFVIGLGALAAGAVLWFTAPAGEESAPTAMRVVPAVGTAQVGLSLQGGF